MTDDDFKHLIEIKKEYEFSVDGERFNITYGTEDDGRQYISLAPLYMQGPHYYSYRELMATARVHNYWLKDFISSL